MQRVLAVGLSADAYEELRAHCVHARIEFRALTGREPHNIYLANSAGIDTAMSFIRVHTV